MDFYILLAIAIAGVVAILLSLQIAVRSQYVLLVKPFRRLRLHVVYPRLFRWHGLQSFNPTRAQLLFYLGHIAVALFGNLYGPRSVHAVGVRAGQLSLVYLVPLLAFRQLHWLSSSLGINLHTFKTLHGSLGAMATVQALIHAVISMQNMDLGNGDAIVGISCLSVVLLLAVLPLLRRFAYELFLRSHFALSIGLAILLWRHLQSRNTIARLMVISAVSVLAASSVLSFMYQSILNVKIASTGVSIARVSSVEAFENIIVLQLSLGKSLRFRPGQYIMLSLITLRYGSVWQRHPLTIAWWQMPHHTTPEQNLWVVVRKQKGWTARLAEASNDILSVPAWIGGPYGQTPNLSEYGHVLMFASADGVFAQLPLIRALTDKSKDCNAKTRLIRLVWQTDEYHDQLRHWMQTLLDDEDIDAQLLSISVHLTAHALKNQNGAITHTDNRIKHLGKRVRMIMDVPDYGSYIRKSVERQVHRIAVVVSAHRKIREEIRKHVLAIGKPNVEFIQLEYQPQDRYRVQVGTAA